MWNLSLDESVYANGVCVFKENEKWNVAVTKNLHLFSHQFETVHVSTMKAECFVPHFNYSVWKVVSMNEWHFHAISLLSDVVRCRDLPSKKHGNKTGNQFKLDHPFSVAIEVKFVILDRLIESTLFGFRLNFNWHHTRRRERERDVKLQCTFRCSLIFKCFKQPAQRLNDCSERERRKNTRITRVFQFQFNVFTHFRIFLFAFFSPMAKKGTHTYTFYSQMTNAVSPRSNKRVTNWFEDRTLTFLPYATKTS